MAETPRTIDIAINCTIVAPSLDDSQRARAEALVIAKQALLTKTAGSSPLSTANNPISGGELVYLAEFILGIHDDDPEDVGLELPPRPIKDTPQA